MKKELYNNYIIMHCDERRRWDKMYCLYTCLSISHHNNNDNNINGRSQSVIHLLPSQSLRTIDHNIKAAFKFKML